MSELDKNIIKGDEFDHKSLYKIQQSTKYKVSYLTVVLKHRQIRKSG